MQYDSSSYGSVLEAISALEAEAKVGDFGLSRKIQHGRSHASDTRQGTPFFVAPEVAGQRRLHKSSDAYSFGVMMWELFVGCPVYTVQQYDPWTLTNSFHLLLLTLEGPPGETLGQQNVVLRHRQHNHCAP